MKVLLTGACGFVGRHMLRELQEAGHEVVAAGHHGRDLRIIDVRDPGEMLGLVEEIKPEGCIHLAGIAFVPAAWKDPHLAFSVNVYGTVNMLEAFRRIAPQARFVLASTSLIYGNTAQAGELPETTPANPESLYALTKLAADLQCLLYARRYAMSIMTARPANHIGPGQSTDFVVPSFAKQVADIAAGRREPVMRVGNLDSEREFTDVRDITRAYRLLLEKGTPGEAYNISSGCFLRIRQILDTLCGQAGVQPRIEVDPQLFRPTDTQPRLNTAKLRSHAGWAPRFAFEQTLRDTLQSFAV